MVAGIPRVRALFVTGVLMMPGCVQQEDSPAEVTVTQEMAEMLAKADALDGETNKIVSLCAPCSLGMDGLPEHSLNVGDYTLYFCKDYCKQRFSKDITKSVLTMKVPAADDQETP